MVIISDIIRFQNEQTEKRPLAGPSGTPSEIRATQEAEAGGLEVQDLTELKSEFTVTLDNFGSS